jgi:hypothetical protein
LERPPPRTITSGSSMLMTSARLALTIPKKHPDTLARQCFRSQRLHYCFGHQALDSACAIRRTPVSRIGRSGRRRHMTLMPRSPNGEHVGRVCGAVWHSPHQSRSVALGGLRIAGLDNNRRVPAMTAWSGDTCKSIASWSWPRPARMRDRRLFPHPPPRLNAFIRSTRRD